MGKKKVVEPITQEDMKKWSQFKATAKAAKKAYEDICAKIRAAYDAKLPQEAGEHYLSINVCDEFPTYKYGQILEELLRLGAVVPREGKLVPLKDELEKIKAEKWAEDGDDHKKGEGKFYTMTDRMTVSLESTPTA